MAGKRLLFRPLTGTTEVDSVGIAVASRTTRAPKLDEAAQSEFIKKAQELAPKYRTELLKPTSELPPD